MNKPKDNKSITFIGFMGVGKTSIAKVVAKNLSREFIDSDKQIEQAFNMPTTEIFKKYGEAFFRKKEKEHILALCQQKNKIIALGGGAFIQKEIREFCMEHTTVVYLDIAWHTWKKRLDALKRTRPILQNRSIEEIELLFEERKKFYKKHHYKILIHDNQSIKYIADQVVKSIAH